jgi:hypothetical protein
MVLVLQALRAALAFVSLREIPVVLARFLDHLERPNARSRPKKIQLFLDELRPPSG